MFSTEELGNSYGQGIGKGGKGNNEGKWPLVQQKVNSCKRKESLQKSLSFLQPLMIAIIMNVFKGLFKSFFLLQEKTLFDKVTWHKFPTRNFKTSYLFTILYMQHHAGKLKLSIEQSGNKLSHCKMLFLVVVNTINPLFFLAIQVEKKNKTGNLQWGQYSLSELINQVKKKLIRPSRSKWLMPGRS